MKAMAIGFVAIVSANAACYAIGWAWNRYRGVNLGRWGSDPDRVDLWFAGLVTVFTVFAVAALSYAAGQVILGQPR